MQQYVVSCGQAWKYYWKGYVDIGGRSSRSEFWWAGLILAMITIGYNFVWGFIVSAIPILNIPFMVLWWAFSAGTFLPTMMLSVRRLHDIGWCGAWIFINLIPVVGPILMLIFTLLPSEPCANRYGPVPNVK